MKKLSITQLQCLRFIEIKRQRLPLVTKWPWAPQWYTKGSQALVYAGYVERGSAPGAFHDLTLTDAGRDYLGRNTVAQDQDLNRIVNYSLAHAKRIAEHNAKHGAAAVS